MRLPVLVLLALTIALSPAAVVGDDRPRVAVTFSVLADLARDIAGEDAQVTSLTPVGAEVHEWELTARNFAALEDADIVFYNGYNLEQWMGQVRATTGGDTPILAVAQRSEWSTLPIVTGDMEGAPDPHLWMDPRAAAAYARVMAEALAELVPEKADAFHERADALEADLKALHQELTETLKAIPEDDRTLVTSEAAFLYFADAYGFEHTGIWGTNSEEEGTPRQVAEVTDFIRERQPRSLFWESTISDRHVRGISGDTGIPYHGPLYVDSLSAPDGDAGTYTAMMRYNARMLVDKLAP
ncbi:zinc ABC transporter solute-binding protein [Aquisalimonas sp. 2447]|uniref:metal ABC transporter solute-binding protein, Zn/Mn family n=1 Tax=Aquisalimonas sp. 2447 TaxID=2740807 RepID=UPI00143235E2|nr:zinc ABC transporter substrate-binding protein [Aquisalimonas sp. 2447]QIT54334.1 zinc ABC transporter solute-binding protein [Aquisalimonas sp. 2447]